MKPRGKRLVVVLPLLAAFIAVVIWSFSESDSEAPLCVWIPASRLGVEADATRHHRSWGTEVRNAPGGDSVPGKWLDGAELIGSEKRPFFILSRRTILDTVLGRQSEHHVSYWWADSERSDDRGLKWQALVIDIPPGRLEGGASSQDCVGTWIVTVGDRSELSCELESGGNVANCGPRAKWRVMDGCIAIDLPRADHFTCVVGVLSDERTSFIGRASRGLRAEGHKSER